MPATPARPSVEPGNCSRIVILLDNHLPGVDGVDALPALHEAVPA